MLIDARHLPPNHELAADVCVVGGGPAGIAIARELIGQGITVCLLESGGFTPDRATQRLYRGNNAGHIYFPLDTCRIRYFGGSSNKWGGWCRPFDRIDYEKRAWVPDSGWPFGYDEMEPFVRRAEAYCQVSESSYAAGPWAAAAGYGPLPLDGADFTDEVFQFSPPTRFGALYRDQLISAPNVTVVIHANVVEIETRPEHGGVTGLRIRQFGGKEARAVAREYVLAVGGIENPRLLLASNRVRPNGLGNDRDLVGRYFMEHPHVAMGYFLPSSRGYDNRFYEKRPVGTSTIKGVFVPTPATAAREGILGVAISPEPPGYSVGDYFNAWPRQLVLAMTRLQRLTQQSPLWAAVQRIERAMMSVKAQSAESRFARQLQGALAAVDLVDEEPPRSEPGDRYRLYCRSEQAPNPSSRITLARERDPLGVPRVVLDWRLTPIDLETIERSVTLLAGAVGGSARGRVKVPDGWEDGTWAERIVGGPHHMGTTRMADDPGRGVVDRNCRVHGVGNLSIAGSSVFPTSGYANPTLMLLAMSFRLADHLKASVR